MPICSAGPQGIGKKTFARYLSSCCLCESESKPCGECSQCRQIYEGKHSSVRKSLRRTTKRSPSTASASCIRRFAMHSLDGSERIVLIEPMESLTPQAQNCLLKSLEEPKRQHYVFPSFTRSKLVSGYDPLPLLRVQAHAVARRRVDTPFTSPWISQGQGGTCGVLSGGNVGEALCILDEQAERAPRETALRQFLQVPPRGTRLSARHA